MSRYRRSTTHGGRLAAFVALATLCHGSKAQPAGYQAAASFATRAPDRIALRVRVHADPGLDRTMVAGARDVVRRLLASVHIDVAWRLCSSPEDCLPAAGTVPEVFIILSRQAATGGLE